MAEAKGEVRRSCRQVCDEVETWLKRFLPIFLLILYSFFGAFLFHLIEEPSEISGRESKAKSFADAQGATARRIDFIYKNQLASRTVKYEQTVEVLEWYRAELGVAVEEGETLWGFWGALFYAITLYTTIGYGYHSPATARGRIVTCLYSLVGIPLCLLALVELGWLLSLALRRLYELCLRLGAAARRCYRRQRLGLSVPPEQAALEGGSAGLTEEESLLGFPLSILVFLTVSWLLLCSGVFMAWEPEWDFGTSLYFTFISFSTIGLGDVNPSKHGLMICASALILVGLALVSTVVTLIQQKIEALIKGLKDETERQFRAAIREEADGLPGDPFGVDLSLKKMVYRMPAGSRFIYSILPSRRLRTIKRGFRAKAELLSQGSQTEMRMLQRGDRLIAVHEAADRQRSRDDTNSLVMSVDF